MDTETEDLAPEIDLRGELSAAFEADAGSIDTPAEPVAQTAEPTAAERARDEAGRFAKQVETAQSIPEPTTPQAVGEPEPQAIVPPAAWSAAAKAQFSTLPPVIQQEVMKREKDMNEGLAQRQQQAERFNRLDSLLAPRRERFQLAGQDEFQAVQSLFAAQDFLERNPQEGIAYLARQYGVNLASFAQGQQGQAAQQPMHPVIQQLSQQVQSLSSVVAQQREAEAQAVQSQLEAQVAEFQNDPKNIYFENVRGEMSKLVTAFPSLSLQEAYERAIWANPEIRPLLLQDQQKQALAQAEQQKRAKADAARRASGSVTGSPSPGSSPANASPAATIRDDLSHAWDAVA